MNIIEAEKIWKERNNTISDTSASKHTRRELFKAASLLINNYKSLCEYYIKKYGPIDK